MRIIAAFLLSLVLLSSVPTQTQAQGLNRGFGGKLSYVMPCTCAPGFIYALLVIGPSPGWFLFTSGVSILHPYYQLRSGPNVVGSYTLGGSCPVIVGNGCVSIPTLGSISFMRRIGTSF